MTVQLVPGMMNPLAMVGVAIVIAAEKLPPRPEIVTRLDGVAAIVLGGVTISQRLHMFVP